MYDGRGIANFVLDYCDEAGIELTNLRIQKIIYFCHVWFLVGENQPLIRHKFEAWEYGPVLPYLYRALKEYGDKPITGRLKKIDLATGDLAIVKSDIGRDFEELLRKIISFYGKCSTSQLIDFAHAPDSPWWRTWYHKLGVNPGMQIDNEEIKKFYSKLHQPNTIQ